MVAGKSSIYEIGIMFHKEKYASSFKIQNWFVDCYLIDEVHSAEEVKLHKLILIIAEEVLSSTIHTIHSHIYKN